MQRAAQKRNSGGSGSSLPLQEFTAAAAPSAAPPAGVDVPPPPPPPPPRQPTSPPLQSRPSTEPMLFDLTFNAVQHASSNVGHLRSAVQAMTGKWPSRLFAGGHELVNDRASLAEAGVGLQCTLEIWFEPDRAVQSSPQAQSPRSVGRNVAHKSSHQSPRAAAGRSPRKTPPPTVIQRTLAHDAAAAPPPPTAIAATVGAAGVATTRRASGSDVNRGTDKGGLFAAVVRNPSSAQWRLDALAALFARIDANGDGSVTIKELSRFVLDHSNVADSSNGLEAKVCNLLTTNSSLQQAFSRFDWPCSSWPPMCSL